MPPFGNLFGISVYVDHSLEADEEIVFKRRRPRPCSEQ
jgi:hypothetical protein